MSRESVLLRLLAQEMEDNPRYNLKKGVYDDIEPRLRQSFETLNGRAMFRVEGRGYITAKDGGFGDLSDFVEHLREDAPYFFNDTDADADADADNTVRSRAELRTAADKARWIGEHGADAYMSLPDSASRQ